MPTNKYLFYTKMDALANAINAKALLTGPKDVDELKDAVDSIDTSGKDHTFQIPTIVGTYVYTGARQTPTISEFYRDFMVKSGQLSEVDVGDYSITVSLIDTVNCQWSDGSVSDKVLPWSILSANSLSRSPKRVSRTVEPAAISNEPPEISAKKLFNQKMNALANSINAKAELSGRKNLDELIAAVDRIVVKRKAHTFQIPTIDGSYIYTGLLQIPVITGYYADFMTKSGTLGATDAGSYVTTVSLIDPDNCQWSDGSISDKAISWSIAKAVPPKPTTIPSYIRLSDIHPDQQFTVNRAGDGEIVAIVSDQSKISARVLGTTVRVTLIDTLDAGEYSVRIHVNEGTNYVAYTADDAVVPVTAVIYSVFGSVDTAMSVGSHDESLAAPISEFVENIDGVAFGQTNDAILTQVPKYGIVHDGLSVSQSAPASTSRVVHGEIHSGISLNHVSDALATELAILPDVDSGMSFRESAPSVVTPTARFTEMEDNGEIILGSSAPALSAESVIASDIQSNVSLQQTITSVATSAKFGQIQNGLATGESVKPFKDGLDLYITFTSNSNFTLAMARNVKTWDGTLYYSTDRSTWSVWDGTTISSANNSLSLCGLSNTVITGITSEADKQYFVFTGGDIYVSGDMQTLLDYNQVSLGNEPTMGTAAFAYLFYQSDVVVAPEFSAMTLSDSCYHCMFYECTKLQYPPELPALSLAAGCYYKMFAYSGLVRTPELPATTLAVSCYSCMFWSCSNLRIGPSVLPAAEIPATAYYMMFESTAIESPPKIKATSFITMGSVSPLLAMSYMFYNCTSLNKLPELVALNITGGCYYMMFAGCTSIKLSTVQVDDYQNVYRIPSSGTGTDAGTSMNDMFSSTGGTFTGTPDINTTYYTSNAVVLVPREARVSGLGSYSSSSVTFTVDSTFTKEGLGIEEVVFNGDTFIKIPTLYRKVNAVTNNQITSFTISNVKVDSDYQPYPCFIAEDGVTILPYVLIGKYINSSSTSVVSTTAGNTNVVLSFTDAHTYVQRKGTGYQVYDWMLHKLWQDLIIMMYKTVNINSGSGVTYDALGIYWGKDGIAIDGLFNGTISGGYVRYYVSYKPSENETTSNYQAIGYGLESSVQNGLIQKLGYHVDDPFVNYPMFLIDSDQYTLYYCDNAICQFYASYYFTGIVGGARAADGAFRIYSLPFNKRSRMRLCYRPVSQ